MDSIRPPLPISATDLCIMSPADQHPDRYCTFPQSTTCVFKMPVLKIRRHNILRALSDSGSFDFAARFCSAHDELRAHFRPRTRFNDAVSLSEQRRLFGGALGRGARAAPGGLAEGAGRPPAPTRAYRTSVY